MNFCPTCGQPLPRADGLAWSAEERRLSFLGKSVRFSRGMSRVFEALYSTPAGFADQMELTNVLYADDPDGGPESAYKIVGVYVSKMRKALAPIGWTVTYTGSKSRGGFRLTPLPTTGGRQ